MTDKLVVGLGIVVFIFGILWTVMAFGPNCYAPPDNFLSVATCQTSQNMGGNDGMVVALMGIVVAIIGKRMQT
jgi:hypothetical protein